MGWKTAMSSVSREAGSFRLEIVKESRREPEENALHGVRNVLH
jgi:hypothetical protein